MTPLWRRTNETLSRQSIFRLYLHIAHEVDAKRVSQALAHKSLISRSDHVAMFHLALSTHSSVIGTHFRGLVRHFSAQRSEKGSIREDTFRGKAARAGSRDFELPVSSCFAFIHSTPAQSIQHIMSRQKKKQAEDEEVQVVDVPAQTEEEVQAVEEDAAVGPHPVSLLQVRSLPPLHIFEDNKKRVADARTLFWHLPKGRRHFDRRRSSQTPRGRFPHMRSARNGYQARIAHGKGHRRVKSRQNLGGRCALTFPCLFHSVLPFTPSLPPHLVDL